MVNQLSFDRADTFSFCYKGRRGEETATGYLFDGGEHGVYIMQQGEFIKGEYTDADRADLSRLAAMTPVRDGDTVEVGGTMYAVRILGNYSDAGRLTPVEA